VFRGALLREIENTTLTAVIQRNTSVANLQDNVFFMAEQQPDNQAGHSVAPEYVGPKSPQLHPGPMRPLSMNAADPAPPLQTPSEIPLPPPDKAKDLRVARPDVADSGTNSASEESEVSGNDVGETLDPWKAKA
jgi:hypothetical protein